MANSQALTKFSDTFFQEGIITFEFCRCFNNQRPVGFA